LHFFSSPPSSFFFFSHAQWRTATVTLDKQVAISGKITSQASDQS
jgi:hypothetical protein